MRISADYFAHGVPDWDGSSSSLAEHIRSTKYEIQCAEELAEQEHRPSGARLFRIGTMAESQTSKDAAAQTRIINHMNAEHQDSLICYLRHYKQLSSFSARNATLLAADLSGLTIASSPTPFSTHTYRIPLDPPLTSWTDIRPRLVAMNYESCSGLGCSPITIKKYVPPFGLMLVNWLLCFWTLVTFSRRAHFIPGSLYYQCIFQHIPSFTNFCYKIQPLVFYTMATIHLTEVIYMERSRLRKHTVRMLSGVWWSWLLSDFVEGWTATMRFDRLVKEEEEKKAKQKH